jgi:hypothetical protein
MSPATLAIAIIVTHFVVDWMCQTRKQAAGKSVNFWVLSEHVAINFIGYSWLIVLSIVPLKIVLVNALTHGLIDWYIWRFYKMTMKSMPPEFMEYNLYAKDYWFYFTIAVDQILHLVIAIFLFMPNG